MDDNSQKATEPAAPPINAHIEPPVMSEIGTTERAIAVRGFRLVERILLILIALMTLGAVATEIDRVYVERTINLADILLMFLYTEVIGMVAVFYTGRSSPFVYPIFIAITALARLIVLQGKEMVPQNTVFEAAAIILLAVSAAIILRAGRR